jgi:hypothetical protein
MFCPLCQSEFREGITECSDCHVQLVGPREEAQSSSELLWKGIWQTSLDKILGALDGESIPSYFKEILNTTPQIAFLGIRLTPRKSTFEYQVWIFRSDRERAHAALAKLGFKS